MSGGKPQVGVGEPDVLVVQRRDFASPGTGSTAMQRPRSVNCEAENGKFGIYCGMVTSMGLFQTVYFADLGSEPVGLFVFLVSALNSAFLCVALCFSALGENEQNSALVENKKHVT